MAAGNVSRQAGGLATTRQRELDEGRDAQARRVEQATATTMVGLDLRAEAERAVRAPNDGLGEASRSLPGEEVSVELAAVLVQLDAGS